MREVPQPAAKLAELFYEGILHEGGWKEALRQVAHALDSEQALIVVRDKATGRVRVEEHFNLAPALVDEYNEHYRRDDPALAFIDTVPIGGWYHDRRDLGEAVMAASPFYRDFLQRHGISTVISNRLLDDAAFEAHLSLQRANGRPAYTQDELDRLQPLIPHVQRAVRLRSLLQDAAARAAVAVSSVQALKLPLVVADETGHVVLANADAEAFMRRRPEVKVRHGRLLLDSGTDDRLEPLLKIACGSSGPARAGGMRFGPRHREVIVVVAPLPAPAPTALSATRPLALVLLHDMQQAPAGGEPLLQEIYRLTPAEARVTLALARGAVPAQIAAELGISLATVRTQMKAIFLKTGTARQADLVRAVQAVLAVAGRTS